MNPHQSLYTKELAEEILERLAEGEPLRAICRSDAKFPTHRTISNWRKDHPDFDAEYKEARREGFDAIATRARATARGKSDADGGDSTADVQRDKLIIETDLKLLAKWDPSRYGDRTILAGDPEAPLAKETDEALDARLAALLAKRKEAEQ